MAPVGGRPFLELLLDYWAAEGVRRFVLSVGHLANVIVAHFGRSWRGLEIEYAREVEPLGTGGGLLLAASALKSEEVLVLNGDTFFAVDLASFTAFHRQRAADCTIALFRTRDAKRYMGMALDEERRITQLSSPGCELANGGIYLYRTESLRALPWKAGEKASLENDLLPAGQRSGWRLYGKEYDRAFIDIGVPDDYARAAAVIGELT